MLQDTTPFLSTRQLVFEGCLKPDCSLRRDLIVWQQHLKRALEMGVSPTHLRTSYNLIFLEEGCIGSWKRMVVSLSSL